MHREISHADDAFHQESDLSLYLLTGLIGLLIGLDLWPAFAGWEPIKSLGLPTWPRELYGPYRFALLAAVLGGARILYGSVEGLLEGKLGADLALAIACIAAILIGEPLVAAEVVFIGMVGECLESFTFARTQRAIRQIVEICPRRCWLLRNGQEVRVLTSELKVGDRVVVKPGGRVPADGIVIEGRSAVDASALTGESLPIDKGPADEVLAGSLNQFGALTIEAQRVAEHTVVGRVIELTARALKDKAPMERTADRLARYFLPLVLALASLTFLGSLFLQWGPLVPPASRVGFGQAARLSVYPMLAVLVVACPCALILATPAAIIAALGRLAGTGILIKGGSALERLAHVNAIAFDKTGTLTEGRLELGDVVPLGDVALDALIHTAATAEQRSEHPLARLILQESAARHMTLEPIAEFQAHPGAGVVVQSPEGPIIVGTRRLLEEQGVALPEQVQSILERLDADGQTALLVARNGHVLGVIGARDRPRPEAAVVIRELRELGIKDIAILTGDREAAARSVAAAVGITDVHAELLPTQKAEFITRWRTVESPPRKTAMVGDGINDAPALAQSDVGLAIGGTGTDVAAEAGDVVLMGDPLPPLPLLMRLSRETVRIIRQNIFVFAFAVNGIGIVLTAWLWPLLFPGWLEQAPLAGVIYHQLGSLLVLLNSMRLLWFERTSSNAAWLRTRDTFFRVDRWVEHNLNVDEILHTLSHYWKRLTFGVLALAAAIWALSGLLQVGPDEVAVVRRFGKPLHADLGPGLHWCWPWPIDTVVRVQPDRVRTVEIGFRSLPTKAEATSRNPALTWANPHRGENLRRVQDEAVMITGDGNLVELQATIRYTIDQPRVFLFEVKDAESALRAATESVLRETVASQPFLDLLTINRDAFQRAVLKRVQQRCTEYGPHGLGIRLDGLSLNDLHPPQEVVPAYHEVARAMEARAREINVAKADAIDTKGKAEARAQQTVREAEAEHDEKVRMAEAARDGFLARLRARSQLSASDEWLLARDALWAAWHGQDGKLAHQDWERRRKDRVALQTYLTDFRLVLDMVTEGLGKRDKIIIDADKVPGRRHLFLMDSEWFRPPPPVLIPSDRTPRRPPRATDGHEGP
ncbi:MAG: cation-translocating P-type ATPase family protein [Gemmataceae bacterium]|nr:cation-translocating P-type ATPase family protein [Gemmataceae bacterium]